MSHALTIGPRLADGTPVVLAAAIAENASREVHAVALAARNLQQYPAETLLPVRATLASKTTLRDDERITLKGCDRILTGRGWVLPIPAYRFGALGVGPVQAAA